MQPIYFITFLRILLLKDSNPKKKLDDVFNLLGFIPYIPAHLRFAMFAF